MVEPTPVVERPLVDGQSATPWSEGRQRLEKPGQDLLVGDGVARRPAARSADPWPVAGWRLLLHHRRDDVEGENPRR